VKRWAWLLLLPIVWVPLVGLVVASGLPWYAWVFGVLFWIMVRRRRAASAAGVAGAPVEGGAVYSPVSGGGGF
jgi:hypothetical protein